MNARATFAVALTVLLATATAGCGEEPAKDFAGKTLAAGETLNMTWDAGARRPISVYLPIGVLRLRLDEQTDYLDDGSEHTFADVRAEDGAELVGIAWDLDDVSAYPIDVDEALMAMSMVDQSDFVTQGDLPAVIDLAVDADDRRIDVPALTKMEDGSDYVVVGVPEGSTPTFEVTFDGETQVVDLATGQVTAGRAAPLASLAQDRPPGTDQWRYSERTTCSNEGQPELIEVGFACGAGQALELPYVRGIGWAETTNRYVLLDLGLSVAGARHAAAGMPGLAVTLDGAKAMKTIDYGSGDTLVFSAAPNSHHKLRIKGTLDPSVGDATIDKELNVETWRLR
ncbi:hypothetical protein [Nocardioides albus]|uniref:Uncharacterized protein n=1 Tax=Nocardioides albus TaxID=1841 RepID=A0A7W5A6U0_9ACTN|nr:hypothetical protein [Nocardioides albus]MBB3090500.1 hypothetical protein [Nocardioides albus]GGU24363.1 hypothetical protein GCM10007979_23840 [Nocardioides albus]